MPTSVHLDTDLAGDIDDLCALALLLRWPAADLRAITTVADGGGQRAGYARYVLRLAGRDDVPVAAGADAALPYYREYPGLPNHSAYWPEPVPPAPGPIEAALDLLDASIEAGALILTIGALTNLRLLNERQPGRLRQAQIVSMGGYVFPVREGYPAWGNRMDYNFQSDVSSAQVVLGQATPLLVPLSVTVETYLRRSHLPRLRAAGGLGMLMARQSEAFAAEYNNGGVYGAACAGLPDDLINWQHDSLAAAVALGYRDGVEVRTLPLAVSVEDGWLVERLDPQGKDYPVVVGVDGGRFSEWWMDVVCGPPHLAADP
jgi:purine nucleosidase